MSIVFVDGPDYSGKTTLARKNKGYMEWSDCRVGPALREYFVSAEPTSEETVARCKILWDEWLTTGSKTRDLITVDRSPLSTFAEQILGDATHLTEDYLDYIVNLVNKHGMLNLDFISLPNALLLSRASHANRLKDAREVLRDEVERNRLYHEAFWTMCAHLSRHCMVDIRQISKSTSSITFSSRNPSLSVLFGEVKFTSESPPVEVMTELNLHLTRTFAPARDGEWLGMTIDEVERATDVARAYVVNDMEAGDFYTSIVSVTSYAHLYDGYMTNTPADDYCHRTVHENRMVIDDSVKANDMGIFTVSEFVTLGDEEPLTRIRLLAAYFINVLYKESPLWTTN